MRKLLVVLLNFKFFILLSLGIIWLMAGVHNPKLPNWLSSILEPIGTAKDESKVRIARQEWKKEGFGLFLVSDFWIENGNAYAIKDVSVECIGYSPSNSKIDSNRRVIYQIIPANTNWYRGSAKEIFGFDMGVLHEQVSRVSCKIIDYKKV
jgi:hypothetical protein